MISRDGIRSYTYVINQKRLEVSEEGREEGRKGLRELNRLLRLDEGNRRSLHGGFESSFRAVGLNGRGTRVELGSGRERINKQFDNKVALHFPLVLAHLRESDGE